MATGGKRSLELVDGGGEIADRRGLVELLALGESTFEVGEVARAGAPRGFAGRGVVGHRAEHGRNVGVAIDQIGEQAAV